MLAAGVVAKVCFNGLTGCGCNEKIGLCSSIVPKNWMLHEHICERLDWLRTTNATALDRRARFFLLCRSVMRFDGYIGSCRLHGASILFRVCSPLAALAFSSITTWDQFMAPVVTIEK